VTPERPSSTLPFRASIEARSLGVVDVIDVQCEAHQVARSASDIRRQPSDTYYVYEQIGPGAWLEQAGRRMQVGRGDVVLADPNIELATGAAGSFDFRVFRVPRHAVDPYLAVPDRMPMLRLRSDSAESALVRGCLTALWAHAQALDPRVAEPVTLALVRLVALCAGVAPNMTDELASTQPSALLQRALLYLARHFADSELSPPSVARALGVSVRALHLAFEPSGRSFSERLSEHRLDEARALLTSPLTMSRPIAEIACDVGFRDLSTFYRAFRAKWGLTPARARAAARAGEPA
jgi:AraC-like DNA-binding protein